MSENAWPTSFFLGRDGKVRSVALPVLAGTGEEQLLAGAEPPATREGCALFRNGSWWAGFAVATPEADLETATRELYQRLFAATAG